jgi:pimeloyl-ACP methyl ester carboxylesterase
MEQNRELGSLADLIFGVVGGVVATIEGVHQAIARRSFGAAALTAPVPAPMLVARTAHDGISQSVYAIVRGVSSVAAPIVRMGVELVPARPESAGTAVARAALNGFAGDLLEEKGSALRVEMALRRDGRAVPPEPGALAREWPDATGKIAVFLHGLCETEYTWRLGAERYYRKPEVTHGARLREDLGFTPLWLRYNTGLHVSENSQRLSALLTRLVRAWPVPLEEIALVGHSMGGLVARSACHYGGKAGASWIGRVRNVFYLGSPHDGAPLEKVANVVGWELSAFDETRPFAEVWNGRSVGIKDLRFGYLLDEDWEDSDLDALLEDNRHAAPLLETTAHHFLAATVPRERRPPVGRVVGDLFVRFPSASGRADRRIRFDLPDVRHFGGLNHFELLNHPAVYERIREALEAESPA